MNTSLGRTLSKANATQAEAPAQPLSGDSTKTPDTPIKELSMRLRNFLFIMVPTTMNGGSPSVIQTIYLEHEMKISDTRQINEIRHLPLASVVQLGRIDGSSRANITHAAQEGDVLKIILTPRKSDVLFIEDCRGTADAIFQSSIALIRSKIDRCLLPKLVSLKNDGWMRCGKTGLWIEKHLVGVKLHDPSYSEAITERLPLGWESVPERWMQNV